MSGSVFTETNLTRANLGKADLGVVHLRGANLGGICLEEANLTGVRLNQTQVLSLLSYEMYSVPGSFEAILSHQE